MNSSDQLAILALSQRHRLESFLTEFESAWHSDRLNDYCGRLESEESQVYRQLAILELVKIDLQRRWSSGQGRLLENYLAEFPRLGTAETVAVELILAEYEARRSVEADLDLASYASRFPNQFAQLSQLASRVSEPSLPDQGPKSVSADSPQEPAQATIETSRIGNAQDTLAPQQSPPAGIPEEFGRYRILRQLGSGAMGVVYLAHDTQLDRQVALKTPSFGGGADEQLVTRFYREARAAAKIQHRNICPVYDVGEIEGKHFISMAFVKGRNMSEYITPDKLPPQKTSAILIHRIATALAEAHRHNVVHRDLKPANIIIDLKREPVVMDFGLARQTDVESRMTQSGMIVGTPAYMSPEQLSGKLENIGPSVDIYALGVILYELLTGKLPFRGGIAQVIYQIAQEEPTPPSELRAGIDPDLELICAKMMAKRTSDRYQTMDAVASALKNYVKRTGTMSRDVGGDRPEPSVDEVASEAASLRPGKPKSEGLSETGALNAFFAAKTDHDPRPTSLEPDSDEHPYPMARMLSPREGKADRESEPPSGRQAVGRAGFSRNLAGGTAPGATVSGSKLRGAKRPEGGTTNTLFGGRFTGNRKWIAIGLGVVAGFVLLALGIFLIQTPYGTIRIETFGDLDGLEVSVDGDTISLTESERTQATQHEFALKIEGAEIKLDPESKQFVITKNGTEHRLSVSIGDLQLSSRQFTVTRNQETVIKIELLPTESIPSDTTARKQAGDPARSKPDASQASNNWATLSPEAQLVVASDLIVNEKRYREAIEIIDRICRDHPNVIDRQMLLFVTYAFAYAAEGDREGHMKFCQILLDHHAGTKDSIVAEKVARAYLLYPGADDPALLPGVEKLSRYAAEHGKGKSVDWNYLAYGITNFRMKQYSEATQWLNKTLDKKRPWPSNAALAYRAMIEIEMGDIEKGRSTLRQSKKAERPTQLPLPIDIRILDLAIEEAERLLVPDQAKRKLPIGPSAHPDVPPAYDHLTTGKWVSVMDQLREKTINNGGTVLPDGSIQFRDGMTLLVGEMFSRDALIRAKVKKTQVIAKHHPTLGLRRSPPGQPPASGQHHSFKTYLDGWNRFGVGCWGDGKWNDLQVNKLTGPPHDSFFEWTLAAVGDQFQVFVDGKLILDESDGDSVEAGYPTIWSGGVAIFKDVEVMVLDKVRLGEPSAATASAKPKEKEVGTPSPSEILISEDWQWSQPVNLGRRINSRFREFGPCLSEDGLTLLWGCQRKTDGKWKKPGPWNEDIWQSVRSDTDSPWEKATKLAGVNTTDNEATPELSTDGLTLLFSSDRPGGRGGHDLWQVQRSAVDAAWGKPISMGAAVNSPGKDIAPDLSSDGLTLLFNSDRKGGHGGHDLWMCTRPSVDGSWCSPINLGPELNTAEGEFNPVLLSDGMALLYIRRGNIWIARRDTTTEPFGKCAKLPGLVELNWESGPSDPFLTRDAQTLYYASGRKPTNGGPHDIWMCHRFPKSRGIDRVDNDEHVKNAKDESWTELFNGRDLAGWSVIGANGWRVDNGVLVGNGKKKSGWLMSNAEYEDFELELEYKLSPGGNSGVFFRAWPDGKTSGSDFHEIQLLDDTASRYARLDATKLNGALYGQIGAKPSLRLPPNQWHRMKIVVIGSKVQVRVNNRQIVDGKIPAGKSNRGHFGFQLHLSHVEFRNIRIKESSTDLK